MTAAPETCSVCLNALCLPAATTPCGHVFHANCIAQSLEYNLYVKDGWGAARENCMAGRAQRVLFHLGWGGDGCALNVS